MSTASSMQPGQLRSGPWSDPTPLSVPQTVVVFFSPKRLAISRDSLALGLGVLHTVAHHKAHDGHGARDGAAGLGHAAHAGAKALGEGKGDLGVEPHSGRERASDSLGAVKAAGVVLGSLSLAGGSVELGGIDLLHRCLLVHGVPAYGTLAGAFAYRDRSAYLIVFRHRTLS